jgi:hypothetical protein
MAQLSEDELREAAAEAGISPQELRQALALRDSGVPEPQRSVRSLVGGPARGVSARHAEGRLPMAPAQAVAAVRASIERQTGRSGHRQGDLEADVVDDEANVTYRVRAEDDGDGGALVRIDVDPTAGKGLQAVSGVGIAGVSLALVALGWLFSATTLWLGGLGVALLGGLLVGRSVIALGQATTRAAGIAAQALVEAEEIPQAMLPGSKAR